MWMWMWSGCGPLARGCCRNRNFFRSQNKIFWKKSWELHCHPLMQTGFISSWWMMTTWWQRRFICRFMVRDIFLIRKVFNTLLFMEKRNCNYELGKFFNTLLFKKFQYLLNTLLILSYRKPLSTYRQKRTSKR